jgi:hypothetical protein
VDPCDRGDEGFKKAQRRLDLWLLAALFQASTGHRLEMISTVADVGTLGCERKACCEVPMTSTEVMRKRPLAAASTSSCAFATRLRCLTSFCPLFGQLFCYRKATGKMRRRCIHSDGVDGISFQCERCWKKRTIDGVRAGTETWQINKAPLL